MFSKFKIDKELITFPTKVSQVLNFVRFKMQFTCINLTQIASQKTRRQFQVHGMPCSRSILDIAWAYDHRHFNQLKTIKFLNVLKRISSLLKTIHRGSHYIIKILNMKKKQTDLKYSLNLTISNAFNVSIDFLNKSNNQHE